MKTFPVGTTYDGGEIKVADAPRKKMPQRDLISGLVRSDIEACSRLNQQVVSVPAKNQFFEAVHLAHAMHFPLIISPDALWVTIAQGLANHINENAERLRKRFVSHEGKQKIFVRRDEFLRGSPENDWPGAFAEFSAQIKTYIGDETHSMIVADFSTTGPVEKAASEVVLMDAMRSYFQYGMVTCCGIPTITLEGSVEDWERLRAKARAWSAPAARSSFIEVAGSTDPLGLAWWTDSLAQVLDKFVEAAKGVIDRKWWNSIVNVDGGSGVPTVGGWLNWLFPYLDGGSGKLRKNEFVGRSDRRGPGDNEFPSSVSKVPFEWKYYDQVFDYEFLGGVLGIGQDVAGDAPLKERLRTESGLDAQQADALDLAVKPLLGWAIRQKPGTGAKKPGTTMFEDPSNYPYYK
jgi:hypothetical protein